MSSETKIISTKYVIQKSVKIDHRSCVYTSTMDGVGVIISYNCEFADSKQLYLVAVKAADWCEHSKPFAF